MKNDKETPKNNEATETPRTVEIELSELDNVIGGRATLCIVYDEDEHF